MSNYPHSEGIEELAAAFRTLSDPFRLKVFLSLKAQFEQNGDPGGPAAMSDMLDGVSMAMNMSPVHVEHQLMELWRAGLLVIGESPDGQLQVEMAEETLLKVNAALHRSEGDQA